MVYELLSEVESDSDEQAQEEPADEEPQKNTSRADPLNAHYGEPESVARSGWVMRQSQGSPNRCTFYSTEGGTEVSELELALLL